MDGNRPGNETGFNNIDIWSGKDRDMDGDGSVTPAFSQHLNKLFQQSAVAKGYEND